MIPSPPAALSQFSIGPLTIHAYALCIIAGIVVATLMTERRWTARGGAPGQVLDVILWAVPFGIVGGRIYHVLSSPDNYFGPDGELVRALYIWRGGLGIWGAVALGALGAWIGCRRSGIRFAPFMDAVAPGLLVAQAIGRFGNWFNQELFGRPTDLPWGLLIDPENRPAGFAAAEAFHPTFLYEALWCLGAAAVLLVWDRRTRQGHGRVFWGYVVLYTLGRVWIEALRIDPAERVLGLRLNVWTSVLICAVGLIALVVSRRGREAEVLTPAGRERVDAEATARGSLQDPLGDPAPRADHGEEAQEPARHPGGPEDPQGHPQGAGQQAGHGEGR